MANYRKKIGMEHGPDGKKPRKPKTEFTPERQAAFLDHYAKTGHVCRSAMLAGVHDSTVHSEAKRNPEFKEAWDRVKRMFQEFIEEEAIRRAIYGTDEPVYQKGERVMEPIVDENGYARRDEHGNLLVRPATIKRYSDRLLELMLKRHIPEYRERVPIEGVHIGGVLAIPVQVRDDKEWERIYGGQKVASPEIRMQRVDEATEVEYEPVKPVVVQDVEYEEMEREPAGTGPSRRIRRG